MKIDVYEKTTLIKHDDVVNNFCTMAEIVSSCGINEKAAKSILEALPTDFLQVFATGLQLLHSWTLEIIAKRGNNGH